jgi:integrase/recombinase XerD
MQALGELYGQFVEDRKYLKNVSRKTLAGYKSAWGAFGPHLSDVAEETAVKTAVKAAIIAIQKDARKKTRAKGQRAISDGSINNYLTVVKMDRLIHFVKLKTLKKVRSVLTPEEIDAFLKFKPSGINETRLKCLITISLDCGLRLMEVRKLKKENIDLDNLLLKIFSGKGRKQRLVPFSEELRKVVYRYMRDNSQLIVDGFLFGTSGKKLYSQRNISRDLTNLCAKLGLRHITFHQLRHTFATEYLKRGGDLMKLKRIMGHSTISTTQIYEHMQTEDLQEGFDRLSSINTRIGAED